MTTQIAETRTLSLVLLTFNRWDRTVRLLESMAADPEGPASTELVWVDNGSSDGTPALLREWLATHPDVFGAVVERRNETNHGFVVGVNEGVAMSSGSHVVLINSDTIVPPWWRRDLLETQSGTGATAVGPVSDGMPWNQSLSYHGTGLRDVPVLYGFCLLTRRAAFDEVGLLDERYGRGVAEVEDWCERVSRGGGRFVVNTDILVAHDEPHASYTPRVNSMLHVRNRDLFTRKWGVGPYLWGDRTGPERRFRHTVVSDRPWGLASLRKTLDGFDPDTELLVVAPHSDEDQHLSWIRLARRDARLNVVCVPGKSRTAALDALVAANARGPVEGAA